MATQPSVRVNGYEIGTHPMRRIVWAETEGLLEATKPAQWTSFETFSGPGRNHGGDMDYPARRLSIVVRISKQDSFLGKHEALAALSEIFSGKPAIVQVGSLYVEAEFAPAQIVKDAWKLTAGYLTVRFDGEAIPGTYFGEYGFELGRDQGVIINDDRPDNASLIFAGNSFTLTAPGTAPTEAVASMTNTSLASTTVYLKGAQGQMMPVNLDATGYGRIDEAYGFLLYPGANAITIVDSAGALIATGTFSTCFYGTRFRFIGNSDNRMADGFVLNHARTASATYLSTAGTLTTAGDGVARIGVPWVTRRNLVVNSILNGTTGWTLNAAGTDPSIAYGTAANPVNGAVDAFTLTDDSAVNQERIIEEFTIPANTSAYLSSVYVMKSSATHLPALRVTLGSNAIHVQINTSTGALTKVTVSGSGSGFTVPGTATDAGAFWRIPVSFFGDGASTTSQIGLVPSTGTVAGTSSGTGTGSATFWGPQFEQASAVTPYQPTNATGPDLTNPLNGAGLVLEGSGTNLLTYSQDFANAAWTKTGITATNAADPNGALTAATMDLTVVGALIDQTTSQAWGTATFDGSFWLKGSANGIQVQLQLIRSDTGATVGTRTITLTTAWERYDTSAVGPGAGNVKWRVTRVSTTGTATIAWAQVEAGSFTTSYIPTTAATATRQPDLCGIVPLQQELIHSHDLTQGAVGSGTWNRTAGASVTKSGAANTLTLAATTDAIYQAVTPASVASTTRTAAARLKLGTLSGSVLLRLLDQSGNVIASKTIATTDLRATDTRTFYVTGTAASDDTGLRVQIIGNSGTGTVIVESLRLVKGSHPGMEVQTGDTAIPAPVSPALDPAWQQNGRISFRILPAPPTPPNLAEVLLLGIRQSGVGKGIWRLIRRDSKTSSDQSVAFDRAHDGASGSGGTAGRGLLESASGTAFFNSAPHDAELEWTNEIRESDGVREMWQRLYIDGVLVASQDVAALYGATAWAEIDPSRLISDGNVFSTLSDVILDYPTPRAGYRQVT